MSRDVIQTGIELVRTRYVFPDKAAELVSAMEASLAAGEYDGLDNVALGERITAQMFEVCRDRHLRFRPRHADMGSTLSEPELEAAWREGERISNYRVARVERLDGNIGYIDLRGIASPDRGGPAITAAMELVAHTYALIFDLRRNSGGSPDGVQFWCSYLVPDSQTHLNSIFDAESGQTKQFWSLAYVPGERYLDRPVYVLTSETTFSGGEELCYNLQALGRATLIGQTTRGGAHPTMRLPLSDTLEITVPVARSINPITQTNWEGTGVEPDVAVPAAEAYSVAYRRALEHVLESSAVAPPPSVRDEARAALDALD